MKRVALFLGTNLAIVVLLGIVVNVVGANQFITESGLDLPTLLVFTAIFGMGGSFISLAMSKWIALKSTRAQIIDTPRNAAEQWLLETVHRQAEQAGIGMPSVAVYDSPDVNAFATGAKRNDALVAVSTGLLRGMDRGEVEAVLGHEVSHVANGDMVTLALIQGVVNTFVMFFARIIGFAVDAFLRGNNQNRGGVGIGYFVATMVAELVLGFLASMIVMWFSRQREFRADVGGAALAGRQQMISALERLGSLHQPTQLPSEMAAFGIHGSLGDGLKRLFMSHPPIEERIAALRQQTR
jgi:heat shock protein HtpX